MKGYRQPPSTKGTKPKFDKEKARAKNKAARKVRAKQRTKGK
jgi:hypothetical protein